MPEEKSRAAIARRVAMSAFGAFAALALWLLGQAWLEGAFAERFFLALMAFAAVFSGTSLVLAGPLPIWRACLGGVVSGLISSGLITLGGLRFEAPLQVLDHAWALPMILVLVMLSLPFLSLALGPNGRWLDYVALFDRSWSFVIRTAAAGLFLGLFWLVFTLSDALLSLVGLELLQPVLDAEWLALMLSGAVLGLALSVLHEMQRMLSPVLVLQLLRLLLPVLLAVVAVFLIMLPVRGMSALFGSFSPVLVLMAVALGAIGLIAAALDRAAPDAVTSPLMVWSTRLLAVVVPVLAALAVCGIVLRVGQYGWTPARVLAATIAGALSGYGVLYLLAVVRQGDWMARLRSANLAMALVCIALSASWLTPILDAQRISSQNQVARFADGRMPSSEIPFRQMAQDWGRAGDAAIQQLTAMTDHPEHADILARLEIAQPEPQVSGLVELSQSEEAAQLAEILPVRPGADRLKADAFASLPVHQLRRWRTGCTRVFPDGTPGCVLLRVPLIAEREVQGVLMSRTGDGTVEAVFLLFSDDRAIEIRGLYDLAAGRWPVLTDVHLRTALNEPVLTAPTGLSALVLGEERLVPTP